MDQILIWFNALRIIINRACKLLTKRHNKKGEGGLSLDNDPPHESIVITQRQLVTAKIPLKVLYDSVNFLIAFENIVKLQNPERDEKKIVKTKPISYQIEPRSPETRLASIKFLEDR